MVRRYLSLLNKNKLAVMTFLNVKKCKPTMILMHGGEYMNDFDSGGYMNGCIWGSYSVHLVFM